MDYICTPCKAQLPVADFTTADTAICPGTCISFTNLSLNADSYQWIFPGAFPATDTAANPQSVCYENSGMHDVTLIATNSFGSDTLILHNYITVYPPPPNPNIYTHGDTIFVDQGYAHYQWYLGSVPVPGDTNYYCVAIPDGVHSPLLTDSNGCQIGMGTFGTVFTPDFASSDTEFCAGSCINFTDLTYFANGDSVFATYQWILDGANPSVSLDTNPQNICYENPGIYEVKLIVLIGTISRSDSFNVTVHPYPLNPIITGSNNNGDTLFAPQGYVTYQWFHLSDSIPGATNYFYVIAFGCSNYNLIVTDSNGCAVGAGILCIIGDGINEYSQTDNQITISPNPASDAFTVSSSAFAIKEISIFNVLGESVYSVTLSGVEARKQETINCKLQKGIYFVRVGAKDFVTVKKLIVE